MCHTMEEEADLPGWEQGDGCIGTWTRRWTRQVVEEETVVRVPKEMFLQAMEMAMKSGKTNIRVEIIGS